MKHLIFFALCFCSFSFAFAQNDAYSEHYKHVQNGEAYYRGKNYTLALGSYEKAIQSPVTDQNDYYNAACCASLLGDINKAHLYLIKSIDMGYWDLAWMMKDADFDNLRKDEKWNQAVQHMQTTISNFEKLFAGVKGIPLTDLVPYNQNGKWGYLQKKTRKTIVKANFKAVSFAGDCLEIKLENNKLVGVDSEGKLSLKYNYGRDNTSNEVYAISDDVVEIDSSADFKGFRMDAEGVINRVSSQIDQEDGYPIIKGPVDIDGKKYAIARKKGKYGLFGEDGSSHPVIGFKYKDLDRVYNYKETSNWYLFQDEKNKYGFIHTSGESRFYGEIDSLESQKSNYEFWVCEYEVVQQQQKSGIIDLKTMKWLVKPLSGVKFLSVHFTHKYPYCEQFVSYPYEKRDLILETYFLAKNKAGQTFYVDKEGIQYLPLE